MITINQLLILVLVKSFNIKERLEKTLVFKNDTMYRISVCDGEECIKHISECDGNYGAIVAYPEIINELSSASSLPIVPLRISFQDILRAILMSKNYGTDAAFVGSSEDCSKAHTICQLLQYDIPVISVEQRDVPLELERLKNEGYSLIIGDETLTSVADDIGLGNVPAIISSETVHAAIEQAAIIVGAVNQSKLQINLVNNALAASDYLIIILDDSNKILYISSASVDYDPVISFLKHNPVKRMPKKQLIKLGNSYWNIEKKTLYIQSESTTCLYIQKQHYDLEDIAMRGIVIASHSDLTRHGISESYLANCTSTCDIVEDARNYAKLNSPTIIFGEPGVGKNSFANIIHKYSPYKENHVVVVDCELVELPTWTKLLHEPSSILTETDVVYFFKNYEQVPQQIHSILLQYLRRMCAMGRNKYVFSCNCSGQTIPNIPTIAYLVDNLRASWIYVPPIRERLNDLSSLCSILISSLSAELGSQIIGLEPNAISVLKGYGWPGNLNQLRRFLAELIASSNGYYISAKTVTTELKREITENMSAYGDTYVSLDLSGSLEDIEKRIILQILHEEDQNQTSAAKRLGISRSTLWRKLRA